MYSSRVPPPLRAMSAASGDFDPESPRRNSQTGEIGPTPVTTFAPPPTAIQNPLFNIPGVPPPSRLPPPPQRPPARGGSQEVPPPGVGFQRPSGLPQPGFLAGMPSVPSIPSVPRTGSWPMKEAGIANSYGGIGSQNRPLSNAPSPTVLSPTQANTMMMNEEAPSAILQVSQPNVGMVYAPQRGGSGSPSMMAAAQQYAAAFQQQQQQYEQEQQQQQQQQEQHYATEEQYAQQQQHQQPMHSGENTEAGNAGWDQEMPPEMVQMYKDTTNSGYNNEAGGLDQQNQEVAGAGGEYQGGYEGGYKDQQYNEHYNDQQQYYDNQQYNQYYDENTAAEEAEMAAYNAEGSGNAHDGGNLDDNSKLAYASTRKLPPPAVSFESPIKARFARGAVHPSVRQGALTGAFNKAAMTGLPPPPSSVGLPQMPHEIDDGYNAAGMNDNPTMMMQGFPSGGFAGSSVASAPVGEESGTAGGADSEVDQQGETAAAVTSLPPPPPMMGAPGGTFPTFGGNKPPALARNDSSHSQPGSARSGGGGGGGAPPLQFGGMNPLMSAGNGNFMGGNTRASVDGPGGQHPGVFNPSSMMMPQQQQPGSPQGGGDGLVGRTSSSTLGQQQRKDSRNKPRKQRRRGICSVLFMLTLVLTLSAALSVGTTIVAVTFTANMAHAAISGIGSIVSGASLSSAIASMHPAAVGIAQHVDTVSQAQWRATENKLSCDESKPACRGARLALHSARLFGFLTKDAALFTAAHAPSVMKQTAVPAVHFAKQQSALLLDQLKGMKTPEGRDAIVASIHQSAGEVKKLGQDLFVWVHCVYQHLSQSGVHSINHIVEPAAGCWVETMGHYYLDGSISGTASGSDVGSSGDADLKERWGNNSTVEDEEIEAEEEAVSAPPPPQQAVESKEQSDNLNPDTADAAPSPVLLEEEEEEEGEIVEEQVETPIEAPTTAPVVRVVEEEEVEKAEPETVFVPSNNKTATTTNTTAPTTPAPASEVKLEEELPKKQHEHEVEEEDELAAEEKQQPPVEIEKVQQQQQERLPPPPPTAPSAVGKSPGAPEQKKQIHEEEEEEIALPEAPEIVIDTKTTTKTPPRSGLPDRYASEEEYLYMVGGDHPSTEENEEKQGEIDQGPPGASIISKTTQKSTPSRETLWPSVLVQFQKWKIMLSGVTEVIGTVKQHQSNILVALGAGGGTALLFVISGALAARRAAYAARFAGAAQLLTPRRLSAAAAAAVGGQEAPATVFKSARSGRKTKTTVQSAPARLIAPAFEEEEEGAGEVAADAEPRGRKSSRGGASKGRSRSKAASETSRGRKSAVDGGASGSGGRKASVSRRRSTKAT